MEVSCPSPVTARIRGEQALRPSRSLPCPRILCGEMVASCDHFWDLPCNQCILCWLEPMLLVWCILCQARMKLLTGGWGGLAASRPICEEVPLSMGYRPRTERSGAWHRGKGPGYGQKPHAEEHTQPRVHSRVKDASCIQHPRAEFATGGLDRIL